MNDSALFIIGFVVFGIALAATMVIAIGGSEHPTDRSNRMD